ncbi:MAG: heme exporter protein CcmD [Candidatus Symbiobacter sp.]|nr:heme exporter protein CcmD [Candidatus Symbiobacter sp.]
MAEALSSIGYKLSHFSEFMAMGGYGFYVWSCYGLGLVVLAALVMYYRRRLRQALRDQVLRDQVTSGDGTTCA